MQEPSHHGHKEPLSLPLSLSLSIFLSLSLSLSLSIIYTYTHTHISYKEHSGEESSETGQLQEPDAAEIGVLSGSALYLRSLQRCSVGSFRDALLGVSLKELRKDLMRCRGMCHWPGRPLPAATQACLFGWAGRTAMGTLGAIGTRYFGACVKFWVEVFVAWLIHPAGLTWHLTKWYF